MISTATSPAVKSAIDSFRVGTLFVDAAGVLYQVTEGAHFQQADQTARITARAVFEGRRGPYAATFRRNGLATSVVLSEAPEGAHGDPAFVMALDAVAAGTALWLPAALMARLPDPIPLAEFAPAVSRVKAIASSRPRHAAIRHIDPLHHYELAVQAVCQLRADWLADKPSEAPCCPADEPSPCQACISHPEPADAPITSLPAADDATEHDAEHLANELEHDAAADGDWDDSSTWELGPPDGMTLAELADHEALIFRSWQTAAGELFAAHMAALAASIRAVDAMTPGQYRDRFDAMTDAGF